MRTAARTAVPGDRPGAPGRSVQVIGSADPGARTARQVCRESSSIAARQSAAAINEPISIGARNPYTPGFLVRRCTNRRDRISVIALLSL